MRDDDDDGHHQTSVQQLQSKEIFIIPEVLGLSLNTGLFPQQHVNKITKIKC